MGGAVPIPTGGGFGEGPVRKKHCTAMLFPYRPSVRAAQTGRMDRANVQTDRTPTVLHSSVYLFIVLAN